MKLFKISRIGNYDYDEYIGFVVRAINEDEARYLVKDHIFLEDKDTWTNKDKSSCEEILLNGNSEIILESYNAG